MLCWQWTGTCQPHIDKDKDSNATMSTGASLRTHRPSPSQRTRARGEAWSPCAYAAGASGRGTAPSPSPTRAVTALDTAGGGMLRWRRGRNAGRELVPLPQGEDGVRAPAHRRGAEGDRAHDGWDIVWVPSPLHIRVKRRPPRSHTFLQ